MAGRLIEKVMDVVFGNRLRVELQQFFELFGSLLGNLNHNQTEMKSFFRSSDVGFLLVTSPAKEAREEAGFFAHKAGVELGMQVCGYILNRSYAGFADRKLPAVDALHDGMKSERIAESLQKLLPMATRESRLVMEHRALAEGLEETAKDDAFVWVLPFLGQDASYLDGLVHLARAFTDEDGGGVAVSTPSPSDSSQGE